MSEVTLLNMGELPYPGAEEWVPHYTDEPVPIEATEAYLIYKNFDVKVGAINPRTGNDYLLDWINDPANASAYERIQRSVRNRQTSVDDWHLRQIRTQERIAVDLRRQYAELSQRLEDVKQGRRAAQNQIENLNDFLNPDGMVRELSPYDDTSDIDTVMENWMGREFPLRLTSLVAQQWYKRFSFGLVRGNRDVTNYGPFIGGTPYYRPSLQKRFIFDGNNYGQPLRGIPMTVVDQQLLEENPGRFGDLSRKVNQWESFGVPLPMNEWGTVVNDKQVNEYGYISGAAQYNEEGQNLGGTHVASYDEFLELFGLATENTIIGAWPKPSDTPMFTVSPTSYPSGGRSLGWGAALGAVASVVAPINPLGLIGSMVVGAVVQYVRRQFNNDEKRKFENKPWNELYKESTTSDAESLGNFTMIDEYGNIACPNTFGFGNEPYVQSGWSLMSGGQLVYLYPDWDNAIAYNPGKAARGDDPWIPHAHGYRPSGYEMDYRGGVNGNRNGPWGKSGNMGGGDDEWRVGMAHTGQDKQDWAVEQRIKVQDSRNKANDRRNGADIRGGGYTHFIPGPRLNMGDHNPNLTIQEKRALVINRGSTRHQFMPLGRENPLQDGQWANEHKAKGEELGKPNYGAYSSYKNPKWPYGTGWYWKLTSWDKKIYGSRAAPITGKRDMGVGLKEAGFTYAVAGMLPGLNVVQALSVVGVLPDDIWGSNYGMYVGDLLMRLPHRGQFTIVNDDDNSPTIIEYDGTIRNGKELNVGFVDFVARELIHLGVKNRRIGTRKDDGKIKTYTIASHSWKDRLTSLYGDNPTHKYRIQDTTFGDLFGPDGYGEGDDGSDDGTGGILDFADFSQKVIKSVAEIPIRREVVDNLLNKTNENMSLMQFLQNIMHPSALGVSTGNIYTMIRPSGGDGHFEVVQGSKNWAAVGKKVRDEVKVSEAENKFPEDVMLFDYKASDSLIKSIDMSSKFDPGVAGTFERAASNLSSGTKTDLIKFLSYGNMALELKQFLESSGPEENPQLYKDVIRVDEGDTGSVHVDWSRMGHDAAQDAEKIHVPDSMFSKFLMQDPDRMTKLMSVIQTGSGANWATDLLANYMRGCTITLHGTCNIQPFNYIYVTGVLPSMKGLYLVHNVRDSVTPQDFDTIIEAVLIDPNPSDENKDAEKAAG